MKNVVLLYDKGALEFDTINLVNRIETLFIQNTFSVTTFLLKKESMMPCSGCYKCWIKTPGLCIFTEDNVNNINKQVMQANTIVFITNITYGGMSPDIKRYLDRIIPIVLPTFTKINNEMHHKKRYETYPNYVMFGYQKNLPENEKQTFYQLFKRNMLNFHAKKGHVWAIDSKQEFEKEMNAFQTFLTQEVVI